MESGPSKSAVELILLVCQAEVIHGVGGFGLVVSEVFEASADRRGVTC